MRPYRVEYVQLAGWEADEVGLWVAENDEWLLLRSIPVDYMVDGYSLFVKAHITSRTPHKDRKQVERVLKLKGVKAEPPAGFQFLDTLAMLRWVEQRYGLVELADREESIFLGWIREADPVHFWMDMLSPQGELKLPIRREPPCLLADIQVISFDSDYFNSMKLLWQYRQHLALRKPSDN